MGTSSGAGRGLQSPEHRVVHRTIQHLPGTFKDGLFVLRILLRQHEHPVLILHETRIRHMHTSHTPERVCTAPHAHGEHHASFRGVAAQRRTAITNCATHAWNTCMSHACHMLAIADHWSARVAQGAATGASTPCQSTTSALAPDTLRSAHDMCHICITEHLDWNSNKMTLEASASHHKSTHCPEFAHLPHQQDSTSQADPGGREAFCAALSGPWPWLQWRTWKPTSQRKSRPPSTAATRC